MKYSSNKIKWKLVVICGLSMQSEIMIEISENPYKGIHNLK